MLFLKGLVHPKIKISLCFTHPQSILGVYDSLLSDESNRSFIKNCPSPSKPFNGVSGCFLSTVQKTWNKVHASVIKCVSHGSGGWIKASCSKSLRFCKINIHISNIINTFFSPPLTVVDRSCSGGWRRTYVSRAPLRYASLTSLFTGAKEAKFPYFSKGKPVSIFLYKSSFCVSNLWPQICFVLSLRSSLITQRRKGFLVRQSAEVRKKC